MLRNYIKIALRKLWKDRVFSFINIIGLAIGLTAGFLIYLYVHFETSFDSFHKKGNRIFRLVTDIKTPSDLLQWNSSSFPMAIILQKDFPEVESVVKISNQSFLVRKGNTKFQEKNSLMADSTFFEIFDFPLIQGDKKTVLKEPMSVVLSETMSSKYFGNNNPIGQIILLSEAGFKAKITGVMKDIPDNTQIKADLILSLSSDKQINGGHDLNNEWTNFMFTSYLLLKEGANSKTLESKMPNFLNRHIGKQMKVNKEYLTLFLEPLGAVHLYSTRDESKTGNINNVYIFSIIGVFIILIAGINFINLTTARSVERAKEVGIRKVVGATKVQLLGQFLGESVLISLLAYIITILLSAIMLPLFNRLSGEQVSGPFFSHPLYSLSLLLISMAIGILAGFYPAFVLSSYQPVKVLKGRFFTTNKGIFLRKGLVIFQFTIAIFLIVGTSVVYLQLNFMRNQDLGFTREQMVVLNTEGDKNKEAFKLSIASLPGVKSSAFSSAVMGGETNTAYTILENKNGEMQVTDHDLYFVDFDYINQFKLKLLAGRSFSKAFVADTSQSLIINETAARQMGYVNPQNAINKKFDQWGRKGRIIGVVMDFHNQSLQTTIMPLSLRIQPKDCGILSIQLIGNNIPSTLKLIESKWNELIPNRPFEYNFADAIYDKQYRVEDRFGNLFLNFSILAIFISCLGLLGLSSYSTLQRTREIGVRKVLGGSVLQIIKLLSQDFLKLVFIAFLIASPIGWLVINFWLKEFAYRTPIYVWVFILPGVLALIIAFATISFQAVKAAVANPVKNLRTE